uniref:Ig-like domain-containing protein n=1 Tax=Amphiprion percula TaxID=161767 RepID=A0A3P8TWZ8_AMPPE
DISCIYNSHEYHVESKFWFCPDRSHQRHHSQSEDIRGDSQYGGRAEVLEAERGSSTLRIRNLTDADSAQYHFKFTTRSFEWKSSLPGTALTVTATVTQLIVTTAHSHMEAALKCHSSCSPADSSYEDRFNPGDVISCALKGHEDYGSPSVCGLSSLCKYHLENLSDIMLPCSSFKHPHVSPPDVLNVPSVSVSLSAEIMEGSSVTLTCSSDADSAANHTWNKKNQTLVNKSQQLVFSSIQVSDSGDYSCTAENQLGKRTSEYIFINCAKLFGPPSIIKLLPQSAPLVLTPGVRFTKQVQQTLSLTLNSELIYSEIENSEFSVSQRLI